MSKIHFVLKSGNKKIGVMPATLSERETCPKTCPWYNKGCYALSGPCRIHWNKVSERGTEYNEFLGKVKALPNGQVWRHNVTGDLQHNKGLINRSKLKALALANKGKQGYTYTHHDTNKVSNQQAIKQANELGFAVNLSANSIDHADKLKALNIGPVAVVLASDSSDKLTTPQGNKVIVCPSQSKGLTCLQCKLCSKPNRQVIIGFKAHGTAKKSMDTILKG
jgi:hypothetical protein